MSMPLLIAPEGQVYSVRKVGGDYKTRRRLESLGIVENCTLKVLSHERSGVIVQIGDSRLALDQETSSSIVLF